MNYARTKRSCIEAFGPHNGSGECEVVPLPAPPMDWQDKVVVAACAVAVAALIGMWVVAWLA